MLFPNPYRFNKVNPRLFYGNERINVRNRLVRGLANGGSFAVVGGRRIGKTTLLRSTDKELTKYADQVKENGFIILPVYIDIQSLGKDNNSVNNFYQSIVSLMNKRLSQVTEITLEQSVNDFDTFKDYLIQIQAKLSVGNYDLKIAFIFDEIELLTTTLWGETFFNNWRALLSNTEELQDNVGAVFCGASEMRALTQNVSSPLRNILNMVFQLRLFSKDDTQELMSHPIKRQWSTELVDRVHTITGGHPFLIQYIMQEVCNHDFAQAEQAISVAVQDFITTQKYQFESWWNKFDRVARVSYDRLYRTNTSLSLAELASGFQRSEVKQSLETLTHTGVVLVTGETDESIQVSLAGTLFKDWYANFGSLEPKDLADHVRRLILDEVEVKIKSLVAKRLDQKYGSDYLQKRESKSNSRLWKDICNRRQSNSPCLSNQEIMYESYFHYPFSIILMEWNEFASLFTGIAAGSKKADETLRHMRNHLNAVRNKLCHPKPNVVTTTQLVQARIYCEQLLEALSYEI